MITLPLPWPDTRTEWRPSHGSTSLLARESFFFVLASDLCQLPLRILEILKRWAIGFDICPIFFFFFLELIVSTLSCLSRRAWADSVYSWQCSFHLLSSTLSSALSTTTRSMVPRDSTSFPTKVTLSALVECVLFFDTSFLFAETNRCFLYLLSHRFLERFPQPGGWCCSPRLGFSYRTRQRRRIRVRVK